VNLVGRYLGSKTRGKFTETLLQKEMIAILRTTSAFFWLEKLTAETYFELAMHPINHWGWEHNI